MKLFFILHVIGFILLLIASYKYIDMECPDNVDTALIACLIWPVAVPFVILTIIIRKIHKLLLKL